MGRRSLPGSVNPRRSWSVPAVWKILCPLIAIPAVVAGPSRWTDLSYRGPGQQHNCTPPPDRSVAMATLRV
jgi:hypothetical protein